MDGLTYLTTSELSSRIKYDSRTIRDRLKDSVLTTAWSKIQPQKKENPARIGRVNLLQHRPAQGGKAGFHTETLKV